MYRSKKVAPKPRRRLAIDFDGVIHKYSRGFDDGTIYDPPVAGTRQTLTKLREKWWIFIYTVRADTKKGKQAIEQYLKKYKIPFDEIVSHKPVAFAYIDDRAIHFKNWSQSVKDLNK
ncbi:MAG: hypothetical protein V1853_03360, partial [bacterium]